MYLLGLAMMPTEGAGTCDVAWTRAAPFDDRAAKYKDQAMKRDEASVVEVVQGTELLCRLEERIPSQPIFHSIRVPNRLSPYNPWMKAALLPHKYWTAPTYSVVPRITQSTRLYTS